MSLAIVPFFHPASFTLTYLVYCEQTRHAAVIDPAADFDLATNTISFSSADTILEKVKAEQLDVKWILETHVHADHITASSYIKQHCQAQTAVSEGICQVQKTFAAHYQLPCATNGEQFDVLLKDNQTLTLGAHTIRILHTPGHTPDGCSFLIADHVFIGDTLFMPDSGSARCDFPNGSANELHQSIERLLALPDETTMWICHDYQPNGRELAYKTTVKAQREQNIHLGGTPKQEFINIREQRDSKLKPPKMIDVAVQLNINAGINCEPNNFIKRPLITA